MKNIKELEDLIEQAAAQIKVLRAVLEEEKPKKKIFESFSEGTTLNDIEEALDGAGEFMIRTTGEYKYESFFLGIGYACDWEIVRDNEGVWVLKLILGN